MLARTSGILGFILLALLWWAALWFALPIGVDLFQLSPGALLMWHGAPPLTAAALWWVSRRVWARRTDRRKKAAEETRKEEQEKTREAARQAHQQKLAQRCACVECRAVWVAVPDIPEWYKGFPACVLLQQDAEQVRGAGRETALSASLEQVFREALQQYEALAGLPLYIASGDCRPEQVAEAWQRALAVARNDIASEPSRPDCGLLPGEGDIVSRVLDLFERDPALPAFILLGMDSPLGDAPEDDDFAVVRQARQQGPRPGHAVAAMLLSRPGLNVLSAGETAPDGDEGDPNMQPYWERHRDEPGKFQWRVPLPADFWALMPLATLHRLRRTSRAGAMTRRIGEALEDAQIDAGLRDWPFRDKEFVEDGAPVKNEEPGENEVPSPSDEAGLLDLGWLVHNAGDVKEVETASRLVSITGVLRDFGREIDPLTEAGNVVSEHGDTGAARDMLMLAEALIRAARLRKPALTVMFGDDGNVSLGFARPVGGQA
ncbi:MAG: hypothetical protein LBT71_01130 [Azoarcus sp.]|jgi:hypothetical protein|nr:hypothetical protein [Azoarcus sp.]